MHTPFWCHSLGLLSVITQLCLCVCVSVCLPTARGRCLTCGANTFGQLGHSMEDARGPQCVKTIVHENVDKVSCGDAFTVATTKGKHWEEKGWGLGQAALDGLYVLVIVDKEIENS